VRPEPTRLITNSFEDTRPILPQSCAINAAMRTLAVILVLALITIAGEIYSDIVLAGGSRSHIAAPDPATTAIVHGLKRK
jgi:hypothetical protein